MKRSCSAAKANASIEARQVGQRCLHVAAPASTSTAMPARRRDVNAQAKPMPAISFEHERKQNDLKTSDLNECNFLKAAL